MAITPLDNVVSKQALIKSDLNTPPDTERQMEAELKWISSTVGTAVRGNLILKAMLYPNILRILLFEDTVTVYSMPQSYCSGSY